MSSATVSALICAHNAEKYLAFAIESALAQTRPPHEIVVVNDGSTDGTSEAARRFGSPVRVLDQPKIGLSRARNLAVQSSTGEFLAVLDADDQWTPRRLEVALDAFKQDPSLDLVFGHMRQFRDGEDPETKPAEPAVLPGGAVLRRSAYDRVGSYNSAYNLSEFLDWLMRAREVPLREILLPDVVLHRRIHDRNIGVSRTEEKYRTFLHSIKTGLARRRARPS